MKMETSRYLLKNPYKQGLLEVEEISFNRGVWRQNQITTTTTDTKNIR